MMRYAAGRLVGALPLVFLVALVSLLLVELTPGDAAVTLAGEGATPERIADVRERLGLDQPILERYGEFVGGAVRGDLGESLTTSAKVSDLIADRLPVTIAIGVAAMVLAVAVAVPVGVIAALNKNRWVDRVISAGAAVLMALPPFVVGVLLISAFAVGHRWFPATGYSHLGDGVGAWLRSITLPAIALSGITAAELSRQIRGALVDVLEEDYVRTARAKGLPGRIVVAKHAAKNAAIPVVTVLGFNVTRILGGTVVVERIFAIPGFGSLAVESVIGRDLPTVQGVVVLSATIVVLTNLLVDLSYAYFDPKVRVA